MKYFAGIAGILIISSFVYAEDYSFEVPNAEFKKEKLNLSGNFDLKYSVLKSRAFQDILYLYKMDFYLNGDYQPGDAGVHFKTNSEYSSDSQANFNLYELYGNLNLSMNSSMLLGKKTYNWGKGYAFNPVGYVNPAKDPENPEQLQAGIFSASYEYSKSFQAGLAQNASFDLIVIPSVETIDNKISGIKNTDIAGKLYLLFLDTDIDFMQYCSKISPSKSGFDFSRNILSSLEMHGEFSRVEGSSYLFGIRWLNEWNITTILEYYHNDAGLKLMQDYLYLKMSWPEPFNWVYFTPSIYTVINTSDRSSIIGIPLSYKPITNFEFILWPSFLIGRQDTEFGSKQYENKLNFWTRFYF
ncbi:MAG: hypothetical protein A3J83_06025 [Elusimicrobia bacterium RIFOXYA2_FULL_40_6]|nr:MAG: hypothetical protein A3J83_06025 [Elusimicrobia bacterium RIFOXYA2_FULL_40_6]